MYLKEMKLGKSIEIHVSRDEYDFKLISKIEDVSGNRICVSLIAAKGRPFSFLPTDKVSFIYKDEQRMWRFNNVTAGITKLDEEYVHYFESEKAGESYNRRSVFRVYCGDEVVVKAVKCGHEILLTDEEKAGLEENKPFIHDALTGVVKDLSETGAAVYLNQKLEESDALAFEIPTEFGFIKVKGNIIRMENEYDGAYHYLYGISFFESTKNIQKYIYALQRIQLQNRK